MHKIFQNVFQKLGLSFLYTFGRFEPKLRLINVRKLKFSSFLIKRLDFRSPPTDNDGRVQSAYLGKLYIPQSLDMTLPQRGH